MIVNSPELVPLEFDDIPPGASFWNRRLQQWFTPYEYKDGVYRSFGFAVTHQGLFDLDWEFHHPHGHSEEDGWFKCSKPNLPGASPVKAE